MSSPLVSVVIPCFNAASHVRDAIDSALRQTYESVEVICVDDGSTDDTLALLQSIEGESDGRVRVLSGPNRGGSAARNRGFRHSTGQFIQFLDADDVILPEKIERQVRALTSSGADIAVSDYAVEWPGGGERDVLVFESILRSPLETALTSVISMCNPLYARSCVVDSGGLDERLSSSQDYEFNLRLALNGARFCYVPYLSFVYRRTPGSVAYDWRRTSRSTAAVVSSLRDRIEASGALTWNTRQYLANLYYNTAAQAAKASEVGQYIRQIAHWSRGQPFFRSRLKRLISRVVGIRQVLRLDRWRFRASRLEREI